MPAAAGKYGSKDSLMPSGRTKTENTERQQHTADQLVEMAKHLFQDTQGLRDEGTGQLEDFLKTGRIPEGMEQPIQALYRDGREQMEDQYSVAREQLLGQTPSEGGQLNDQMRDLAFSRARSVGSLETQLKSQLEVPLRERLFNTALGTGFAQPPVAFSGLTSGAGQYGSIAGRAQAEQLHREAAAKEEAQQIGQMIGMGMGT